MRQNLTKQIRQYLLPGKIGQGGFTLVELLTAISIFSLLSSFMIINYRDNEAMRIIKNQSQEAVAGLTGVQNMALTGETIQSKNPIGYRFNIKNCANDCSYKIKAIIDSDPANDILIAETQLKMVDVEVIGAANLYVDFAPPRGKMRIYTEDPSVVPDAAIQETAQFKMFNDWATYCIRLNSVSGRIDMVSADLATNDCPPL